MATVRVWDLPTRVGHWALAALVIVAVLTGDAKGVLYVLHTACGIAAGMIVLFRLFWGFVGNERARFADFIVRWPVVRRYLGGLLRLRPARYIGHNPLGGWMVVALLAVVMLTAFTGMVAGGLLGPGPAKSAEDVHEALGSLLQLMIIVHIAGVLVDWLLTRDNLIRAMINGRKPIEADRTGEIVSSGPLRDARGGSIWLALAIAIPLAVFGGWLFLQTGPANPGPAGAYESGD